MSSDSLWVCWHVSLYMFISKTIAQRRSKYGDVWRPHAGSSWNEHALLHFFLSWLQFSFQCTTMTAKSARKRQVPVWDIPRARRQVVNQKTGKIRKKHFSCTILCDWSIYVSQWSERDGQVHILTSHLECKLLHLSNALCDRIGGTAVEIEDRCRAKIQNLKVKVQRDEIHFHSKSLDWSWQDDRWCN